MERLVQSIPNALLVTDGSGALLATRGSDQSVSAATFATAGEQLLQYLAPESPWRPTGDWESDRRTLHDGVQVRLQDSPLLLVTLSLIALGNGAWILLAGGPSGPAVPTAPKGHLSGSDAESEPVRRNRGAASANDRATAAAIMRNIDQAVFLVAGNGTVVESNAIAEQFVRGAGTRADEGEPIVGEALDDLLRVTQGGEPVRVWQMTERVRARGGDISFAADLQVQPSQGDSQDVEIAIAPIERPGPGPGPGLDREPVAIVFLRNAGEQRRVWQDLRKIQHAREISRAAVGLAHELNNSATALIASLSRVGRELDGGGHTGTEVQHAESAVRRIRRLGMQLERFSGTEPADDTVVDRGSQATAEGLPAELLTETIQDTVSLAVSGTGIRSSFLIGSKLPPVRIPSDALSQALFNVVLNAVEAMEEDGRLHVEVQSGDRGNVVVVKVRDEGHGMDPRIVNRVVQPYFSTKTDGIGMGLTVTLSTLEAYGGTVEIETDPGFGTTVHLILPTGAREKDATSPAPPASRAGGPLQYRGKRVLLVEDDPLVRRSLERTLQSVGCEVESVASGDRAIEVFQREMNDNRPFDLMITDLTMPGRNHGVQLLRRVRELDPALPAVLSSGALHRHNATSYRDAGFQYVLRKPFGEPEVRYALSVALAAS